MKIAMVSQWYEPEPGAAAHPTAIARALRRRGHDVTVLTGFPNYPRGKVYPEYRMRLRMEEDRDGVRVLRVPLHASHDNSAVRRALSLTSFALSASSQVLALRDADVCLVYLTPATVGLVGRVLRLLAGVPYVVYVQDLWPESIHASGFIRHPVASRVVERVIDGWCRRLYSGAEHVAAIAPGMAALLAERTPRPDKVSVVYNWVDEAVFAPPQVAAMEPELDADSFWVMYAGGIGDIQGLDCAVDALAELKDLPQVKLAFVGDGVALPGLRRRAEERSVSDRVAFLGRRPMDAMPAVMAAAHAQLISLRDLPLFHATVPSKTQSVLACGQPVVASVPGDSARIVEEAGAGFTCPPEDPSALADGLRAMAALPEPERREMGRSGRAYYERELAETVGVSRLEHLLASAVGVKSL